MLRSKKIAIIGDDTAISALRIQSVDSIQGWGEQPCGMTKVFFTSHFKAYILHSKFPSSRELEKASMHATL